MTLRTFEDLSITEALSQAGFNTLLKALKEAGLYDSIKDSENITIFAPTNEAFEKLEEGLLDSLLKLENLEKLQNLLKYHVISSSMTSDAVLAADEIETMNGKKVEIFQRNGDILINDSLITEKDIQTNNGIIHEIDEVLIP